MSTRQVSYRASGPTRLLQADFEVRTAWTAHSSNYWTLTLRHLRAAQAPYAAQTTGETVGDAYSLATRSLSARVPVTLYTSEAGLAMADGDSLVLSIEGTGSPAALVDAELWLKVQRIAR